MILFITNLPSFYKVNLFSEISKKRQIFVIYTGFDSQRRNVDFMNYQQQYNYIDLSNKMFIFKMFEIIKCLFLSSYTELNVSGLNEYTTWIALLFSPKHKNSTCIESSYYESKVSGFKGFVKKLLFLRIDKVYASGKSQVKLVKALGFRGEIKVTKGVGLFNYVSQPKFVKRKSVINFLYVGRLSNEKNLFYLIETFNKYSHLKLNIVGFGPLEQELKSIASDNVIFHGPVPNKELPLFYQANDVFILPSKSEPWGLVVEEAFNNGLPVIVSNRVGCADEIVQNRKNGLIFNLEDLESLDNALFEIQNIELYNIMRYNISKMDFVKIAEEQINCYLK